MSFGLLQHHYDPIQFTLLMHPKRCLQHCWGYGSTIPTKLILIVSLEPFKEHTITLFYSCLWFFLSTKLTVEMSSKMHRVKFKTSTFDKFVRFLWNGEIYLIIYIFFIMYGISYKIFKSKQLNVRLKLYVTWLIDRNIRIFYHIYEYHITKKRI